jgi:hypothetical protein
MAEEEEEDESTLLQFHRQGWSMTSFLATLYITVYSYFCRHTAVSQLLGIF